MSEVGVGATWLRNLGLELRQIDPSEFFEPKAEINPTKEHSVGSMTEDQQRLYTLWLITEQESAKKLIEAKYARDKETLDSASAKAWELREKAQALEAIFWISIKDCFQLWNKNAVGVRRDYQVVWYEEEDRQSFLDFLR